MNINQIKIGLLTGIFSFLFFSLSGQINVAQLEQKIEQARISFDVPGLSVGVIHKGQVVMSKGFGTKSLSSNESVNGQTLYAIASNTKAFIGAAMTMLVEEGKVNWNDPVQKYLPEFSLYDQCANELITLEDLLCHRAGLGTFSGDVIWYKSDLPAIEAVKKIKHLEPHYGFRDGYGYSNLMFITAGEVIREVTGLQWHEFVAKRVFKPLGMSTTVTSTEKLYGNSNVATPHKPIDGMTKEISWVNWDNMGAAGGIISSTDDMLKWIGMQLNHGMHQSDTLFSRGAQVKMWTPHNSFPVNDRSHKLFGGRNFSGYGLGWSTSDYEGRKIVNHGGGYDGMYSRVVLMPEEDLGIVVLTNSMKGISTPLTYHIIDEVIGNTRNNWVETYLGWEKGGEESRAKRIQKRIDARAKSTIPSYPLKAYNGTFFDPMYGQISIIVENGNLRLHFADAPKLSASLSHWHRDVFKIEWDEVHAWFDFGTVQFMSDNNSEIIELRFDVPNDDIFFHEIKAVKQK